MVRKYSPTTQLYPALSVSTDLSLSAPRRVLDIASRFSCCLGGRGPFDHASSANSTSNFREAKQPQFLDDGGCGSCDRQGRGLINIARLFIVAASQREIRPDRCLGWCGPAALISATQRRSLLLHQSLSLWQHETAVVAWQLMYFITWCINLPVISVVPRSLSYHVTASPHSDKSYAISHSVSMVGHTWNNLHDCLRNPTVYIGFKNFPLCSVNTNWKADSVL